MPKRPPAADVPAMAETTAVQVVAPLAIALADIETPQQAMRAFAEEAMRMTSDEDALPSIERMSKLLVLLSTMGVIDGTQARTAKQFLDTAYSTAVVRSGKTGGAAGDVTEIEKILGFEITRRRTA